MRDLVKKKSFEESLARLEEIVQALENTDTGLEESVKLYSEGVELAKQCSDMLGEAQQSVKMLKEQADGTFAKADFKVEEEKANDF